MNPLVAKQQEYFQGAITKPEFYRDMQEVHRNLFLYPELMEHSQVKRIEISSDGVVFLLGALGSTIKIMGAPGDSYATGLNCLNSGSLERGYIEMLSGLIKSETGSPVFLDIGANLGYYTLALLKKHKGMEAFAFEPIPETFSYLAKNIALNALESRANAVNLGLSNREDEIDMYYNTAHSGTSSLKNIENLDDSNRKSVKTTTLDRFVAERGIRSVSVIKIDVEGAEELVIEGARETLLRDRPVILCEMMRKWSKVFGYHPNDTIQMMSKLGYKCYKLVGKKLEEMPFMSEDENDMNFFFLHGEVK